MPPESRPATSRGDRGCPSVYRQLYWVPPVDALWNYFHVMFRRSLPIFERTLGAPHPRLRALGRWLDTRGPDVVAELSRMPGTLNHGDFRLDNMVFTADGNVVVLDWQAPIRGPGAIDLAYFISGNLPLEVAAKHEDRLLGAYADELCSLGVPESGVSALRHTYDVAKLYIAYRLILLDQLEFDEGRGTALIETWLARLAALIPDDFETLLDD